MHACRGTHLPRGSAPLFGSAFRQRIAFRSSAARQRIAFRGSAARQRVAGQVGAAGDARGARRRWPHVDRWFDAMEGRETYLGLNSDYYTHVHDLPPQLGGAHASHGTAQRPDEHALCTMRHGTRLHAGSAYVCLGCRSALSGQRADQ
jgi:hypothetical protein